MKIWFKMCIGAVIGLVCGLYLPASFGSSSGFLEFLSGLAVRVGRYAVLPLVLFSLIVSVYELCLERRLFRVYLRVIFYAALTSLGVITFGVLCALFFMPGRVSISIENQVALAAPRAGELLLRVFPQNLFTVFTDSGDFLLPLAVFAVFFGLCLTYDRRIFRPLVEIAGSLSLLFYRMSSFITEFLFIGCAVLSAFLVLELRKVTDLGQFAGPFLVCALFSLAASFVVFPLILYFLKGKKKPLRWMYAQLAPALGAFLSGDVYFSLGLLVRHGKEVLGVPWKVSAVASPFLAVFFRGGSAMVSAVSFVVVLRAYSSLEIGFLQVLWIIAQSFGISLLLGAVPGAGSLVGLAALSALYGKGMEEAFLIIRPVSVMLVGIGAFLDIVSASFVTCLAADAMKFSEDEGRREFI
ncbi:MAG: cation:dicarboxylase symporter family transporter [Spirochaetales bacterium]|jgi:Na+/H+-dicarboxylate symporter|nr:cation:dicarboxylase symporter family transporter [Spirochaetales bacterium]